MAISMPSYIFGGDTGITPEELDRQRAVASALLQGMRGTPRNLGEGLGAIGNALAYRFAQNKIKKGEKANAEYSDSVIKSLFPGGKKDAASNVGTPGAASEIAAITPGGGAAGDMTAYQNAIASIESAGSGDYGAVGPRHKTMGRALGRYQIMESNIGPWSKEALGREVTADEFMADPSIQDAIFNKKFASYVDKYGPEGAAQAWFAGPGGVGKGSRKDSLGTTVSAYSDKFSKALGRGPQEVASLDPTAGMAEGAIVPGAEPIIPMGEEGGTSPVATALARQGGQETGAGAAIAEQANGVPQLTSSEQLGGVSGGIMPALDGGQPATAEQIAQAQQIGQQQQVAQAPAGEPTVEQLLEAAADPRLSERGRAVVKILLDRAMAKEDARAKRQEQDADPLRKLELRKAEAEVKALENPVPKDTDDIREYNLAVSQGYKGSFAEYQQEMKKAGATSVNVGGVEKGFDKTVGEGYGKQFLDMQEQARAAQRAANALDVMEQSLGNPGFYSGAAGDTIAQLKRIGASLGMDPEGISSMEAFNAMSKQAALDAMGGSLGTGFSNADRDFVMDQVPNLGNTPDGNKKLVEIQRALNGRKMEIAQIARDYATANDGRIDPGFDDYLAKWAEENPLFPKPPGQITKEEYDALPSGAEFIAPDGSRRRKP